MSVAERESAGGRVHPDDQGPAGGGRQPVHRGRGTRVRDVQAETPAQGKSCCVQIFTAVVCVLRWYSYTIAFSSCACFRLFPGLPRTIHAGVLAVLGATDAPFHKNRNCVRADASKMQCESVSRLRKPLRKCCRGRNIASAAKHILCECLLVFFFFLSKYLHFSLSSQFLGRAV